MGFMDRWRKKTEERPPGVRDMDQIAVGARNDGDVSQTYNDKNITFNSSQAGYDYDAILRDKQTNIVKLFEQSDYYVDADSIYGGIIKRVYAPFAMADNYRLVGADERVKRKYEEYYQRINLRDEMASIFLQYFKYGNVYIYLMKDGRIRTLPVHLVRIANVMVDGEPVIELNCRTIRDDLKRQGVPADKPFLEDDDLEVRLRGFPDEVIKAVREGKEYVQLNPQNTFVLQDIKEDWMRYAVPMVASCLKAFQKKELISKWEDQRLTLGMGSFVHVKYGDPDSEVAPTIGALQKVSDLFKRAMTGGAQAVTNNWCTAEVIEPDLSKIFEDDKYQGVNSDILSAGGISGIIVNGIAQDGSTFASAQVSMQTAAMRIKQAKDNFCEVMDRINLRLNGSSGALPHSAEERIPRFTFPPVDLTGSKSFQDACMKLWKEGVLSHETLLQAYGYDIGQEFERKKREESAGITEMFVPAADRNDSGAEDSKDTEETQVGRPTLDDTERNSDPSKSITGRQPKGSRPEGSEPQEE